MLLRCLLRCHGHELSPWEHQSLMGAFLRGHHGALCPDTVYLQILWTEKGPTQLLGVT